MVAPPRTSEGEETDAPVASLAPLVAVAIRTVEPPAGSDALALWGLALQLVSPVIAPQAADGMTGDSMESLFQA